MLVFIVAFVIYRKNGKKTNKPAAATTAVEKKTNYMHIVSPQWIAIIFIKEIFNKIKNNTNFREKNKKNGEWIKKKRKKIQFTNLKQTFQKFQIGS